MANEFLNDEDQNQVINAIKEAERNTSGEIQVHIENRCSGNVLDRAAEVFAMLKMHNTAQRNGVLFYLAIKDHKFAILGDCGINSVVPSGFWEEIKKFMEQKFKEGKFAEGLSGGILKTGQKLKEHFPYQKGDINELSDNISFGK